MINKKLYYWWLLPLSLLLLLSCGGTQQQKKMNRRISLWRKDKIPYGTYYAFQNLKYLFPEAEIIINNKSPDVSKLSNTQIVESVAVTKEKKLYLIIARDVIPDQSEIDAMMNFIGQGNHIFISADYIGDSLLSNLGLKAVSNDVFSDYEDSMELSVHHPLNWDSTSYWYPGAAITSYAYSMDSVYATVLGRDSSGHADFVRYTYKSGGSVYVHFTPLAFSNFFLLHKNNKEYYDQVFSYLPHTITQVIWDDYFRSRRTANFSAFRFILSNRSLRWAFWILLFLFGLIYLFESKRKQRVIPDLSPMNNASLDFVKTIGRLYYQRRDNGNLAAKISSHFLDHVRTRYNITTTDTDEAVAQKLSYKTGLDKEELLSLLGRVKYYQQEPYVTDDELMNYNKTIQGFYKQV